jgi:hypothetical protein
VEQQYELTSTPPELVSLAAYVSEDGLVSHQWKERPIGRANFIYRGTPVPRSGSGWVGECVGDFWDSIGNVNEINTQFKKKRKQIEQTMSRMLISKILPVHFFSKKIFLTCLLNTITLLHLYPKSL